MRIVVAGGALQPVDAAGTPVGPEAPSTDLAAAVRSHPDVRWVWPDTSAAYPALVRAGVRVERCHDLALTEALLLGYDGSWGQPRSLAAAWARRNGLPVPADPSAGPEDRQDTLFEPDRGAAPAGADPLTAAVAVYADQVARVAEIGRFDLLVAAESAGALAAVEMGETGLPWRTERHDAILAELLGPRVPPGVRPAKLAALAAEVSAAFGRAVNPDSPAEVLRAFSRAGFELPSTRSWVLQSVEHPAVAPLLAYKELARIHTANGWAWQDEWVTGGRFRPGYVPAGVVSGRWATRGGGGLQIPRRLRGAVVADPGHVLVVADAGQLEPRVLAAMSGDPAMVRAAGDADLYAALAAESFDGDRARAKIGLLAAMYGQTGGTAAVPLAVLRRRYPVALDVLEAAARTGETGGLVRSRLGRTCPPGSPPDGAAARARGRFTRNFVVQATAAEWAAALLAGLRRRLTAVDGAELVFFQHDEVVVHTPAAGADEVVTAVQDAGVDAGRLLFGDTRVRFPLEAVVAECYADAH
ncbi:MAG TPA: bifunctional 3'-5' exonuclease/DNA polymerase [Mycobacteriales bacterium]